MIELLIAGSVVAALLLATTQRQDTHRLESQWLTSRSKQVPLKLEDLEFDYADLPCPWCQAATREDDKSCPTCGQRFG